MLGVGKVDSEGLIATAENAKGVANFVMIKVCFRLHHPRDSVY